MNLEGKGGYVALYTRCEPGYFGTTHRADEHDMRVVMDLSSRNSLFSIMERRSQMARPKVRVNQAVIDFVGATTKG